MGVDDALGLGGGAGGEDDLEGSFSGDGFADDRGVDSGGAAAGPGGAATGALRAVERFALARVGTAGAGSGAGSG